MKCALLDMDTISYFLRDEPSVRDRVSLYLQEHDCLNMSILTYYEIYSGLTYRDAGNLLADFEEFASLNQVIPLTVKAANRAGEWYAQLRGGGTAHRRCGSAYSGDCGCERNGARNAQSKPF